MPPIPPINSPFTPEDAHNRNGGFKAPKNQASKAHWPSTNLWRRIVAAAIPDPEIASLEKVNYAASILGVASPGRSIEIEWHKEEHNSMVRED